MELLFFQLLKNMFLSSPVGFKGNLRLLDFIIIIFSMGLSQMEAFHQSYNWSDDCLLRDWSNPV